MPLPAQYSARADLPHPGPQPGSTAEFGQGCTPARFQRARTARPEWVWRWLYVWVELCWSVPVQAPYSSATGLVAVKYSGWLSVGSTRGEKYPPGGGG